MPTLFPTITYAAVPISQNYFGKRCTSNKQFIGCQCLAIQHCQNDTTTTGQYLGVNVNSKLKKFDKQWSFKYD